MVPDSFKDERYRIDGSVRQSLFFRQKSHRVRSSNRADYHWAVVQSSPGTFRSFNRRLIVPRCQWSNGPLYHLFACPPFSGTNSRRWRNCTNDQSLGKWIIGLSLCLSFGLLLYWTKEDCSMKSWYQRSLKSRYNCTFQNGCQCYFELRSKCHIIPE